jgi:hypothetical protein
MVKDKENRPFVYKSSATGVSSWRMGPKGKLFLARGNTHFGLPATAYVSCNYDRLGLYNSTQGLYYNYTERNFHS